MVDYLVKSPRQASTIYGLDGNTAPRKKSQFYVRFKRNGTGTGASSGWETNMGFVVKSLDRPSIQPIVEEINQYNKKRQITTGYKIQPMKVTLFDTADSMVMQMWNEYSKWYFADFTQADSSSWAYDATTASYNGNQSGFGFQPQPSTGVDSDDLVSPYFFNVIEVYQVFGGEYTQFDLINPKITQFDPDEMDYSTTEAATISMSFSYEGILYRNNGAPAPISGNSEISSIFQGQFNGDTFDVEGATTRQASNPSPTDVSVMPTSDFSSFNLLPGATGLTPDSGNTLGGGSLAQFGSYDFGSLSPSNQLGGGTSGDISYLSSGNTGLATLLNLPVGTAPVTTPESLALSGMSAPTTIDGPSYDASAGALTGVGATTTFASDYIQNNLVGGVAASASLDNNSGSDQLVTTGAPGLTLNSQSYGIINTQRPSYSQIGYNFSTAGSSNGGAFIPGKYNTNGIPTAPIPYSQLNQIDPS